MLKNFEVRVDLSRCTDSMLFDSGLTIAKLFAEEGPYSVFVDLKVVGDVAVVYRGNVYHTYFDFPTGLKQRIEETPGNWQHIEGKQDVQVNLNNWFEYQCCIIGPGNTCKGVTMVCEDEIHSMSNSELAEEMMEVVHQVLKEHCEQSAETKNIRLQKTTLNDADLKKSLQVLQDNGLDEDDARAVLQAIGYTLLNTELFPEVG